MKKLFIFEWKKKFILKKVFFFLVKDIYVIRRQNQENIAQEK